MAPFLWGLKPPGIPIVIESWLDIRVLSFAALLSLASTLLFGLFPALEVSKPVVTEMLKGPVHGHKHEKAHQRNALMVTQIASCFVLLIGEGLCLRSLYNAQTMSPGFQTKNAITVSLDVKMNGYSEA
jgi:hypothetical protein